MPNIAEKGKNLKNLFPLAHLQFLTTSEYNLLELSFFLIKADEINKNNKS